MFNAFRSLAIRETFDLPLTLTIMVISISQFNFGFDQQGFNSTQAMDSFQRTFGVFNEKKGKYELESWWLSLFTSLPYVGFGLGKSISPILSSPNSNQLCLQ